MTAPVRNDRVESLRGVRAFLSKRAWLLPAALAALFCLNGIWWGSVEIWNPDQMAFKDHFREDAMPFSPATFNKPPLYSYVNFVVSVIPREVLVRTASFVTGRDFDERLDFISVWLAKLLQVFLVCAGVYLVWKVSGSVVDESIATITALLLATSAGYIVQAHLITTDLPVVFFMILTFWACQQIHARGRLKDYIVAGVLVGLTGAIKYNGLAVGIALPVFHLYATAGRDFRSKLLDRRLYFGLGCVPLGFLAGNPFAALEFGRFARDLKYLFTTSPQYGHFVGPSGESAGETTVMISLATDHLGWPLFVVAVIAIAHSLYRVVRNPGSRTTATVVAAMSIVACYAFYFATRTNLQVRWVLALVPFLLIGMVPFWQSFRQSTPGLYKTIVVALVSYGAVCSFLVGLRFSWDPRFDAIEWVQEHVPAGSTIESSDYIPRWQLHVDKRLRNERMPFVSGRRRLFERAFLDDPEILTGVDAREGLDNTGWYSAAQLRARDPDFIAVSSIYFDRFLNGEAADAYPEIRGFFRQLLAGESGYEIAFDQSCCIVSRLVYPRVILFVDNRLVILRKSE